MTVSVIDIDTAHCILHYRCKKSNEYIRDPVNIQATVLCVSQVVRIKSSQLFLVKLSPSVNVVVKIDNLNQWHNKILVQKEMVFVSVKPTTLQKGSKHSQRVYATTESSEVHDADKIQTVTRSFCDWLDQHRGYNTDLTTCEPHASKICDDLFSYKGKVTNIVDATIGVYELDNVVRLYVGKVPAVDKFVQLQLGVTVVIQNAHHSSSKQYPKLSIYCCALSSINVTDPCERGLVPKVCSDLQKVLYLCPQSQLDVLQLLETRQTLSKQFKGLYGERFVETLCGVILQHETLFGTVYHNSTRNILYEFLSLPHQCLLQHSSKTQCRRQLISLCDVKDSIADVTGDKLEWQYIRQPTDQIQMVIGMLTLNEQNGEICLRDGTGNLSVVITYCHGNTNVADNKHTCSPCCDCSKQRSGDRFPCPYIHPCCIGKLIAVPVFEKVSETLLQQHRLVLNNLNKGDPQSCRNKCDKYVIFNMKDAILISDITHVSNIKSIATGLSCHNNKLTLQGKGLGQYAAMKIENSSESDSETCKVNKESVDQVTTILTDHKPVKQTDDRLGNEIAPLHKHVRTDGSSIFCRKNGCSLKSGIPVLSDITEKTADSSRGPSNVNVENRYKNNKNESMIERTSFNLKPISSRKRPQLEWKPSSATYYSDNKISKTDTLPTSNETETPQVYNGKESSSQIVGRTKESTNQVLGRNEVTVYIESKGSLTAQQTDCRFTADCVLLDTENNDKCILEFRLRAAKWYHTLYPNSVYVLSIPYTQDDSVLNHSLSNDKMLKMLQKTQSKKVYAVNSHVSVRCLWDSHPDLPVPDSHMVLCNIEDILDINNTEKFVSFEGIIVSRHLVKPSFGPKHNIDGASGMFSRLHVQDRSKQSDIWVYLNDETMIGYRGLIPGATVRFYSLERKVSKSSNVYCRLTVISSVLILTLSNDRCIDVEVVQRGDQCPVVCLAELWTLRSIRGQVFQCVCDVEKILKVSLKCLCEKCGSQIQHGTCSNRACDSGLGFRFVARASAIFDDGTCVAMVTLTGSSVKCMLQLADDQWKCLEDEVSMSGEIFVQQYNPAGGTDLERFIYYLCDNHSVKRPWLLTFRTKCSLDINNIEYDEFSVKHFDTGTSRLSTKCLPFLQLDCLSLTLFDPIHWSMHHIQSQTH